MMVNQWCWMYKQGAVGKSNSWLSTENFYLKVIEKCHYFWFQVKKSPKNVLKKLYIDYLEKILVCLRSFKKQYKTIWDLVQMIAEDSNLYQKTVAADFGWIRLYVCFFIIDGNFGRSTDLLNDDPIEGLVKLCLKWFDENGFFGDCAAQLPKCKAESQCAIKFLFDGGCDKMLQLPGKMKLKYLLNKDYLLQKSIKIGFIQNVRLVSCLWDAKSTLYNYTPHNPRIQVLSYE